MIVGEGENCLRELLINFEEESSFDKMGETLSAEKFMEIVDKGIIILRRKFRKEVLTIPPDEDLSEVYEVFFKELEGYYSFYVRMLESMYKFNEYIDIRTGMFFKFFVKYESYMKYMTGDIYKTEHPIMEWDIKVAFKSDWDVYIVEVDRPLHKEFKMRKVGKTMLITETDWDGEKSKQGIEIIRRGGECDGIIITFLYIEDVKEVPEGKVRKVTIGKNFYFYTFSPDGKEMRYFVQKMLL